MTFLICFKKQFPNPIGNNVTYTGPACKQVLIICAPERASFPPTGSFETRRGEYSVPDP